MKLKSVSFNKYKTVNKGTLDIEPNVTCLIGMNEAGKSNVLTGLEKLDKEQSFTVLDIARHSDEYTMQQQTPPSAQLTFQLSADEKEEIASLFGLPKSEKFDELVLKKDGDKITTVYPAINPVKSSCRTELVEAAAEEVPVTAEQEATQEGISAGSQAEVEQETTDEPLSSEIDIDESTIIAEIKKQVIEMLPRFRYFDSVNINENFLPSDGVVSIQQLAEDPESNQPTINLLKLAEVDVEDLMTYGSSSEKIRRDTVLKRGSAKLNEKLLRAFWPISAVEIQLKAEEDYLKIRIVDKEDFAPGERSRGIQWALAFNIYFLAECDGELKDTVLLIDEPGVFLHIDAQIKMLRSTFKKITDLGNQIVYSTHLPFLIDKRSPQQLRILNKPSNSTEIGNKAWSTGEFGSIPEPARSALGINFDDVFMFGDYNIVVEGPSDQIYLQAILEKLKPADAEEITIVPAYGKENIGKVVAMALLANKSCYALVDADFDLDVLRSKLGPEFEGIAQKVHKINEVTENEDIASIEDLIPPKVFMSSLVTLYNRVRSRDKLDPETLSITRPYVANTEEQLTVRFKAKQKHKLLKTDLSREISLVIPGTNLKSEDALKKITAEITKFLKENHGTT